MRLQILVPQYKEDETIIKNLLNSIMVQQSVDFKAIEVLIGNDGSDVKLSDDFLNSYPFYINYLQFEHTSPAGTRQALLDNATAEYVMFCDADDMFLNNLALYTILAYTGKSFDALFCDFVEEYRDKSIQRLSYFVHSKDERFVHGKVYRRRHLIDNNIKWHTDVNYHEDGAFNILAITTAKVVEHCNTPIYLWKWRDDSLCRSDKLYSLKTYPEMLKSSTYLIQDLLSRGYTDGAKVQACTMVYNTYYILNKPIWLDPMNAKYRYEAEKCFKQYYLTHKELLGRVDPQTRNTIIAGIKRRVLKEGVLLEKFTFETWLTHIEELE